MASNYDREKSSGEAYLVQRNADKLLSDAEGRAKLLGVQSVLRGTIFSASFILPRVIGIRSDSDPDTYYLADFHKSEDEIAVLKTYRYDELLELDTSKFRPLLLKIYFGLLKG